MTTLSKQMLEANAIQPLKRLEKTAIEKGKREVAELVSNALDEIERFKLFIHAQEIAMGQTATEIAELQAAATQLAQANATLTQTNAALQQQLTALQGQPIEDAADVAAVAGVPAFIAGLNIPAAPAPTPQPTGNAAGLVSGPGTPIVTPAAAAAAPVTPAPVTPAPVTPAPVTPAPVTPAPVTLAGSNTSSGATAVSTDSSAATAAAGSPDSPAAAPATTDNSNGSSGASA